MKAFLIKDLKGNARRVVRLPDDYDPAQQLQADETASLYDPAAPPLILPPDVIVATEESVLTQLDRDRERAQMTVLTDGGAKKYVYNRKAVEVIDSRGLTVALLNALSLTDKQKRYPFAYAEMLATGDTLAVVLARFEAGLTASSTKIATIEAQAQKAKRAVRAAPTIVAKQTAAQVNWSV